MCLLDNTLLLLKAFAGVKETGSSGLPNLTDNNALSVTLNLDERLKGKCGCWYWFPSCTLMRSFVDHWTSETDVTHHWNNKTMSSFSSLSHWTVLSTVCHLFIPKHFYMVMLKIQPFNGNYLELCQSIYPFYIHTSTAVSWIFSSYHLDTISYKTSIEC